MVSIRIITCPMWLARPPKAPPVMVPASERIIFHHTDGHHPEISLPGDESYQEAYRYAHDIQNFHMDVRGWNDSGHNFLVCRNGLIFQGRWLTVSAIKANHMVESAHCPNQNDQVGIEHEHKGSESMTQRQRHSSARLQAWIADQYQRKAPLPVDPHRRYFNTACPANLEGDISRIRNEAAAILSREGRSVSA